MSVKRWLQITPHIHEGLSQSPSMISGFYNWNLAFNRKESGWTGEFTYLRTVRGRLKEYDVIFVCFAKPEADAMMIDRIREEIGNSGPIVVGALDYAVEIWDQPFNPAVIRNQLEQCDVIMASEPALASSLKALLNHKRIQIVPHPTNVDFLKPMRKPWNKRQKNIIAMIHRYDNNWKAIFMACMREINNRIHDLDSPDLEALVLSGDAEARIHLLHHFTKVVMGQPYEKFMEYASRQLLCVDSYHRLHTYGRTVVDMAAIGLPLVGTTLQFLQEDLFPDLVSEPYDLYEQQFLIERLIKDPEFYKNCVETAASRVDRYGYLGSVKRFVQAIENEKKGICDVERMREYRGSKEKNKVGLAEYLLGKHVETPTTPEKKDSK